MPKWLQARAVADLLSISYDGALRVMKRAGAKKIGALVRIREDVLQAYLDKCPDHAQDHESTADQEETRGTHISTATTATSALKPTTTTRRKSISPDSSFESQMKALRRRRAS
jgi:hypothetical protein